MKTIIVTGATGNLGKAVVHKMLEEGYQVIGIVEPGTTTQEAREDSASEEIEMDLGDEKATNEVILSIVKKYPVIDAAILTAGGFAMGDISSTSSNDLLQQYQLNFMTAWNIARPVFGQMMQQEKGRIFLVGSRPGLNASFSKGMVAYGLAKSQLFHLAALMNGEAAAHKKNVVTSVLVPSTIDTPSNRESMAGAAFNNWVSPAEIAAVITFYCSDAADCLREPVIKVYKNA